jgi:Flp pilus assembly protein CpaB
MPELVIGVLLIAGCALGALLLLSDESPSTPVLITSAALQRGTVVDRNDVQVLPFADGSRLNVLTGDDIDRVVGKVLLVDLPSGAPIQSGVLRPVSELGVNEGRAGVRLSPGNWPSGVRPGDRVIVLTDADGTAGPDAFETLAETAEVRSVDPIESGSSDVVVTLELADDLARQIAAAGAVRLVQVGG